MEWKVIGIGKIMLPNFKAYEELNDMVRAASLARTMFDPVPPNPERLWDMVQSIVTNVKAQLDDKDASAEEQLQYNCTLDQIQADLSVELGLSADVES